MRLVNLAAIWLDLEPLSKPYHIFFRQDRRFPTGWLLKTGRPSFCRPGSFFELPLAMGMTCSLAQETQASQESPTIIPFAKNVKMEVSQSGWRYLVPVGTLSKAEQDLISTRMLA